VLTRLSPTFHANRRGLTSTSRPPMIQCGGPRQSTPIARGEGHIATPPGAEGHMSFFSLRYSTDEWLLLLAASSLKKGQNPAHPSHFPIRRPLSSGSEALMQRSVARCKLNRPRACVPRIGRIVRLVGERFALPVSRLFVPAIHPPDHILRTVIPGDASFTIYIGPFAVLAPK